MLSFKTETGKCMVKQLLAIFPMNKIKVPSLVLDMAILAYLVLGAAMQPFTGLSLCLDATVALQTILRHQLLIAAVTFGAVLHTFKKSMRPVQIAGGELGVSRCRQQ